MHLFLAKQFSFTETHQEGTETIETVCLPLEQAVKMVINSQITHAPSCVLILKAIHAI
uniref:NUDIX hydrolase n=1 Tax=Planktothrix pseudagardhii TaxID=132604 RepID=A0A9W4CEG5_9CYAN|nr:NUDIX hydrolase [Planktothrix pseudagardhii]